MARLVKDSAFQFKETNEIEIISKEIAMDAEGYLIIRRILDTVKEGMRKY